MQKTHGKFLRQIPTANSCGKFSRQIATANSCGKFPRQVLTANSHGKFPRQFVKYAIQKIVWSISVWESWRVEDKKKTSNKAKATRINLIN